MSNYRLDQSARKAGPFSPAAWTTFAGHVDQFGPEYSTLEVSAGSHSIIIKKADPNASKTIQERFQDFYWKL